VILLALLLYLPSIFFGYGSDADTFRVLDAGRHFVASADYVPSRRPGFLVHELSTYALDQVGGSLLANLGTLFWALVGAACFLRILRRRQIAHAELLALALVIHPVFWYNATATADYAWALGMLLAGFDLLERGKFGWAGLALGLAIGCRISSALVAGPLLVFAWLASPGARRQVLAGGMLAALLAGLAYVLPWDFAEWQPEFWEVSAGSPTLWSPLMQAGRFCYKNLYFWGLPAALIVAVMLARSAKNAPAWQQPGALRLAGLCLVVLLGLQAMFMRYPIEVEYLLPGLPFWLILIGLGRPGWRWLVVLLALIFSYNLVSLNLARPDAPGQASRATLGVWVEPGYLVEEAAARVALFGCASHACYDERVDGRSESE
jgi:hypothetical protein